MLSSLVPGFKTAGHPVKVNRREVRRRRREADERSADRQDELRREDAWHRLEEHPAVAEVRDVGEIPDAEGEGAVRGDPRIRRRYTPEETAEMESIRSPRYPGDDPEHHHSVPGARDAWDAAERLGTIAPVMGNPSIDPAAGDLVAVSYMAGYGGEAMVGYDAMDGVDQLVLGNVDATRELEVESATEGGPLRLAAHESVFSDSHGLGTHGLRIGPVESGEAVSWDSEYRLYGHEPEAGGADWCACLRTDELDGRWL